MTSNHHHTFDVAIKHMTGTHSDSTVLDALPVPRHHVINFGSVDVSKRHVEAAFGAVFGYDLAVDPTTHRGPMVEKADENATHDGRVIDGPIHGGAVDASKVYERLVQNISTRRGLIIDHRVPIHGDRIPFVYLKHRPIETRFQNTNSYVEVVGADQVFSDDECNMLTRLAQTVGIDCGEFDVLRDLDDRIYVVDIANTPAGPPNGLRDGESRSAMARLAESFEDFLNEWTARLTSE